MHHMPLYLQNVYCISLNTCAAAARIWQLPVYLFYFWESMNCFLRILIVADGKYRNYLLNYVKVCFSLQRTHCGHVNGHYD